jgi:hypothetical protein
MRCAVLAVLVAGCSHSLSDSPPPALDAGAALSVAGPVDAAGADGVQSNGDAADSTVGDATLAGPLITTKRFQAIVWEHPNYSSFMLGYIRAGALVQREEDPVPPGPGVDGCPGHWYALKPAGYVCEGRDGVTLDVDDPVVKIMQRYQPRSNDPLPYGYGMSMSTPMYARVPTAAEQKEVEGGDIAGRTKQIEEQRAKLPPDKLPQWPELAMPALPMPDFLEGHAQVPIILPWVPTAKTLKASYALYQTRLGFLTAFEAEGRTFYLTTEMMLVPADRIHANRLADFHGVELAAPSADGVHLPLAWVRWGTAPLYRIDGADGGQSVTKTETAIPLQGWVEIADKPLSVQGTTYLEVLHPPADVGERAAVKASDVTRLDVVKELPERVEATDTWIDVDVSKQTLVLYDGLVPRFATLVATGAGKGHETPLGRFRVYAKHVTSRMSAEEKPAEKDPDNPAGDAGVEHAYRYDDVPYVQFLHEGIALHAAFWHEGFGIPRSHGCINLSPRDAVWLFHRTLPEVPPGWHSINGGRAGIPWGTTVRIHY